MMKPVIALMAAGLLVACSGTQEASVPTRQLSDRERFVAAIEANGCVINISTIAPIMAQASINQDQLATLTNQLEADGMLSPDGTDTVRLSSNNCI